VRLRSPRREAKGKGGRVGEKLSRRASAAGAEANPTLVVGRALEGQTSGGKRPSRISVCGGTDSPGRARLCSRAPSPRASRSGKGGVNGKRATASREARIPGEEQFPEGGTPRAFPCREARDGSAGRKPSRASKRRGRKVAGKWRGPRRPDPWLLIRCRRKKLRRVPSGLAAGVDPPACPEGAREAKRGAAHDRRIAARGAKGKTGRRPKRHAGSAEASTALLLAPEPLQARATPRGPVRRR